MNERGNGASISDAALYHLDPLQVAADLAAANLLTAEQKSIHAEIQMTADRAT